MSTPCGRLNACLATATALHLLALAPWPSPSTPFIGQERTVLSVALAETLHAGKPKTNRSTHSEAAIVPRTAVKLPTPGRRSPMETTPTGTTAAITTLTAGATDGEDNDTRAARAQIEARLRTDLARHFAYPAIARQRGWEGQVLLRFNVVADGGLERIEIARSSGYDILDRAAIEAMQRVERLPAAVVALRGHSLAMQLPVIYRLEDR